MNSVGRGRPKITEDRQGAVKDGYYRLAVAAVVQAFTDAADRRLSDYERLEALTWLMFGPADDILELAGAGSAFVGLQKMPAKGPGKRPNNRRGW